MSANWKSVLHDGFQSGWYNWNGEDVMSIPDGWTPDWLRSTEEGINHRPEYAADKDHALSGGVCAKITTRHASHDGVLYRVLPAQMGSLVRFTASAALWRDMCGHGVRIGMGLDGWGDFQVDNYNPAHTMRSIQWNEKWWSQNDSDWKPEVYRAMSMTGIPSVNYVIIFLHSRSQYKASNIVAFWDEILVEQIVDVTDPGEPPSGDGILESMLSELRQIRRLMQGVDARVLGSQCSCGPEDNCG